VVLYDLLGDRVHRAKIPPYFRTDWWTTPDAIVYQGKVYLCVDHTLLEGHYRECRAHNLDLKDTPDEAQ
jgi:hypothetical protein